MKNWGQISLLVLGLVLSTAVPCAPFKIGLNADLGGQSSTSSKSRDGNESESESSAGKYGQKTQPMKTSITLSLGTDSSNKVKRSGGDSLGFLVNFIKSVASQKQKNQGEINTELQQQKEKQENEKRHQRVEMEKEKRQREQEMEKEKRQQKEEMEKEMRQQNTEEEEKEREHEQKKRGKGKKNGSQQPQQKEQKQLDLKEITKLSKALSFLSQLIESVSKKQTKKATDFIEKEQKAQKQQKQQDWTKWLSFGSLFNNNDKKVSTATGKPIELLTNFLKSLEGTLQKNGSKSGTSPTTTAIPPTVSSGVTDKVSRKTDAINGRVMTTNAPKSTFNWKKYPHGYATSKPKISKPGSTTIMPTQTGRTAMFQTAPPKGQPSATEPPPFAAESQLTSTEQDNNILSHVTKPPSVRESQPMGTANKANILSNDQANYSPVPPSTGDKSQPSGRTKKILPGALAKSDTGAHGPNKAPGSRKLLAKEEKEGGLKTWSMLIKPWTINVIANCHLCKIMF